jgi:hypothetical protein
MIAGDHGHFFPIASPEPNTIEPYMRILKTDRRNPEQEDTFSQVECPTVRPFVSESKKGDCSRASTALNPRPEDFYPSAPLHMGWLGMISLTHAERLAPANQNSSSNLRTGARALLQSRTVKSKHPSFLSLKTFCESALSCLGKDL